MKRLIWYCFSTPAMMAIVATALPATNSETSQRRGTPATASTPNTVAVSTSMVPRSGCRMISSAGMPAITPIRATSTAPTRRWREFSTRSAMIIAIPMTTASLANSAGWMESPPSISHEREPLIVVPITRTSSSPMTEPT